MGDRDKYVGLVRNEVRPRAGATVYLAPHRHPIAMTPDQARSVAGALLANADEVEERAAGMSEQAPRLENRTTVGVEVTAGQLRTMLGALEESGADVLRVPLPSARRPIPGTASWLEPERLWEERP